MEKKKTDGTIIQYLHGSHSFQGVWFGKRHPTLIGDFWWRQFLPTPSTPTTGTKEEVDSAADFTDEEVSAAKETRSNLIGYEIPAEIKAIFMAGEICMWDEMRKKYKSLSVSEDSKSKNAVLPSDLMLQFEKETGNLAIIHPVSHSMEGYASWEYQRWLEEKLCNQNGKN